MISDSLKTRRTWEIGAWRSRKAIENVLADAGITLNGSQPGNPTINNSGVFDRFLAEGRLGLGEAYMEGWWDCADLDVFFTKLLATHGRRGLGTWSLVLPYLRARLVNAQSRRKAPRVAKAHYGLGNDLFEAMLDKRLVYTCAYWDGAADLGAAQEAKLDLVCRKLRLESGMRVLDIGCGYGSFAKFAAEHYGAEVTGITISQEQIDLGRQRCAGLPVTLRREDYRDLVGVYDRVVSLGMFEHVGFANYRKYMEIVRRCLHEDGLFLLQTIGTRTKAAFLDPWLNKYIFPGGALPTITLLGEAVEELFVMEDWHNFGPDYDKTLMAWHANFEDHWPELSEKYDERFRRMWRYYLLFCAGTFRSRYNQLWQIVLSPRGVPGGYARP